MKYIVVTGGVVSGLGKGVTISSMGLLLQATGLRVTAIKIDPYLNVDAGTMSPFEHGEVFVLQDGGESDLDLGNYERFLGITLTSGHNVTTGKVYRKVILAERKGDYLGKTVQVVPHITDCIQDWLMEVAHIPVDSNGQQCADICLIEVGGTVGDIESSVFLEALRQFQFRIGNNNLCVCFVSLVPVLSEEQKTKPTQHGVRDLRSVGLSPSIIFCRSIQPLTHSTKQKVSLFCQVPTTHVLSVHDVSNVYQVPALLQEQGLHDILYKELDLFSISIPSNSSLTTPMVPIPDLKQWNEMAQAIGTAERSITIALIGKYIGLQDSYLSVIKALKHACYACNVQLELDWVMATDLEWIPNTTTTGDDNDHTEKKNLYDIAMNKLRMAHGVIVPGGFGSRGWEGKLVATRYCREQNKPFLGVCLGFQAMVVEYCRHVMGWEQANSTEFDENTTNPVIICMPEIDKNTMGGTMRLGARITNFTHQHSDDDSIPTTQILYGHVNQISERHRHRYEVNPELVESIHSGGLIFVGRDESGQRMEIAELSRSQHPYYVGCQFHPEFLSRPLTPSPPFHGLILAASGQLDSYLNQQQQQQKE